MPFLPKGCQQDGIMRSLTRMNYQERLAAAVDAALSGTITGQAYAGKGAEIGAPDSLLACFGSAAGEATQVVFLHDSALPTS